MTSLLTVSLQQFEQRQQFDVCVMRRSALALLVAAATLGGASSTQSCTSSSDCSLQGDCNVTTGVCACDPQWSGSATCDVLALLPANRSDGYNSPSGVSSWGGM